MDKTIIVIGGGIAGISTIEGLLHDFNPEEPQFHQIVLISTSKIIKKVENYEKTGRNIESFNVSEDSLDDDCELVGRIPEQLKFKFIIGSVICINSEEKLINYRNSSTENLKISYDIICICTGASPRRLTYHCDDNFKKQVEDRILVIRDIDTILGLRSKLNVCRRIVIIGNGGISLELVDKISCCEKFWIIKDESMGLTFFDSGASKFILDSRNINEHRVSHKILHTPYEAGGPIGPSPGPSWSEDLSFEGKGCDKLEIYSSDEVCSVNFVEAAEFPLIVKTRKGRLVDCDLIVIGIGVEPNILEAPGLKLSGHDKGIIIDNQMRTSTDGIYAAGDCVSCDDWPKGEANLWFQMRLWTQARQMGYYAGQCIVSHLINQDPSIYSNFDCFTHCTNFFGFKVILLGRFNGQAIGDSETKRCEVSARVKPGEDYVKLILMNGRVIGAVLIGESGLEETIENLIHDRIDVSEYKDQLLDGTVDIEDYFD